MLIGALEAGGTKMVCSIGDQQGNVLQRASFPTQLPGETIRQIVDFVGRFGVKALGGWSGSVYKAWDDEPQKSSFRVYASAAESFRDHSLVLKNSSRYRSLFSKSIYDYRGWAIGLQRAGYATAKNYAAALIGFIDTYRLYAINGGVKLRAGKTVIVRQTVNNAPTFDADCQMDDEEQSEEEQTVTQAVTRYVVEINDISCTILYPGTTLSSIAMQYDIPKDKLLEFNEVVVEEELHEAFPDTAILRVDADSVAPAGSHQALFRRFSEERIPIMVGTQMIAKGLNFDRVTLVGILSADQSF